MGQGGSRPAPQVDLTPIFANHQANMDRVAAEHKAAAKQQAEAHAAMMQQFADRASANAKEAQEAFEKRQMEAEAAFAEERERSEERLKELMEDVRLSREKVEQLKEDLLKPAKERARKFTFVNGLHLALKSTNRLAVIGEKGAGKSTYLWLLGKEGADKPIKTGSDGTVEIKHLAADVIDNIGTRGWSMLEVAKLFVLWLEGGIPQDLILFSTDRIMLPLAAMAQLGVLNPLIVIMSTKTLHDGINKNKIPIEVVGGVRRFARVSDLAQCYDVEAYADMKEYGLGIGVTHHDDIAAIMATRKSAGVRPFDDLLGVLGAELHVDPDSQQTDPRVELIARMTYVYYKKYNKDALKFVNNAELSDFESTA